MTPHAASHRNLKGRLCAALFVISLLLLKWPATTRSYAETVGDTTKTLRLQMVAWTAEGERLPAAPQEIINAFAEAHPGLRINLTYDRWNQALPRLRRWCGSLHEYAPDLTVIPDAWLSEFAPNLLPVSASLTADITRDLLPSVLARCQRQGQTVGVPWRAEAQALYYRHDLLEAAGVKPPATLGELATLGPKLALPAGMYCLGLPGLPGGDSVTTFLALLAAHGGVAVDDTGKPQLNSVEAVQALQYWVDLTRTGVTPPENLTWSTADLLNAFIEGKLAMILAGPDFGALLRRRYPQIKATIAPAPGLHAPVNLLSCQVLVALANTSHPEEARQFLRFTASARSQKALWMMGGLPTCSAHVAEARQYANWAPFLKSIESLSGTPITRSEGLVPAIEHALWLALSGREQPESALRKAMAEVVLTE